MSIHSVEIDGVLYKPDVIISRVIERNQAVAELARCRNAIHCYIAHLEDEIERTPCDASNPDGGSNVVCEHCQLLNELALAKEALNEPGGAHGLDLG